MLGSNSPPLKLKLRQAFAAHSKDVSAIDSQVQVLFFYQHFYFAALLPYGSCLNQVFFIIIPSV